MRLYTDSRSARRIVFDAVCYCLKENQHSDATVGQSPNTGGAKIRNHSAAKIRAQS